VRKGKVLANVLRAHLSSNIDTSDYSCRVRE